MLSPVLLLAEIYTEHSHVFLGSLNTNHHEHAGASHQARLKISFISLVPPALRTDGPDLCP